MKPVRADFLLRVGGWLIEPDYAGLDECRNCLNNYRF